MFYNLGHFGRRQAGPKSKLVAVYPSGREFTLYFKDKAWYWDHGKASFPQSAAIENVEALGGYVYRKPV